jgi:hypothetical protein
MLSRLSAFDRIAASVDDKPLIAVEPTNPSANVASIKQRLQAAASLARPAVAALILVMLKSRLPVEPPEFVATYYVSSGVEDRSMGDVQSALIAALAELSAYLVSDGVP